MSYQEKRSCGIGMFSFFSINIRLNNKHPSSGRVELQYIHLNFVPNNDLRIIYKFYNILLKIFERKCSGNNSKQIGAQKRKIACN